MSVVTPERRQSFAYTNTVSIPVRRNAHHFQLPLMPPLSRISSVKRFALFVEVVAATIEMPSSHHGIDRPERKNSFELDAPFRLASVGIRINTRKKSPTIVQSSPTIVFAAAEITKRGGGTHSRASAGRSGRPPPGHNGRWPAFKGKRPQTDCAIGHAVPGVLPEVAGRTSSIHSTGMVRSYSWLR